MKNTWNSSALQTLKQLHDKLLTHHICTEWVSPPVADAHALDAPAQGRDDDKLLSCAKQRLRKRNESDGERGQRSVSGKEDTDVSPLRGQSAL